MVVLINYADKHFRTAQRLNSKTAIETGKFDKVISYSPKDIDRDFYRNNSHILKHKRGNGYWLWKPYFIKNTLEKLNEGDYLFYCDSGAFFLNPVTPLIDLSVKSEQDIIPFELTHTEKLWTKRDTFVLMGCDSPEFTDTPQRLCGYFLMRKTEFSTRFINEFLLNALDERKITEIENTCGLSNYQGFRAHRHDQSIFSLLTKKYGLESYPDIAFGKDKIIQLTRKRDFNLAGYLRKNFRNIRKYLFEKKN